MKKQHPIRKMHKAIAYEFLPSKQESVIARHVKPLLDALDYAEFFCPPGPSREELTCLLAEWRAKL